MVLVIDSVLFTTEEAERVRVLCDGPSPIVVDRRPATEFEKRIIRAIFDGAVVVRMVPDFLNILFSSDQLLAFQALFQHKVKGEPYAILPPIARLRRCADNEPARLPNSRKRRLSH